MLSPCVGATRELSKDGPDWRPRTEALGPARVPVAAAGEGGVFPLRTGLWSFACRSFFGREACARWTQVRATEPADRFPLRSEAVSHTVLPPLLVCREFREAAALMGMLCRVLGSRARCSLLRHVALARGLVRLHVYTCPSLRTWRDTHTKKENGSLQTEWKPVTNRTMGAPGKKT